MKKISSPYFFAMLFFCALALLLSSAASNAQGKKKQAPDTANAEYLKERAKQIQETAGKYKASANELLTEYAGYKAQAKSCKGGAIDEANDGYKMSDEAVKDCEGAEKIAQKIISAKKVDSGMYKLIKDAQRKMENSQYLMQQAKDRRKEVLFELRGCK
ncbi:MAG: hypothetical protein ACJ75J_15945 [Cytophagaceae bacterium]